MSYIQSVVSHLTEGHEPHDKAYQKNIMDLGKVLLQASALNAYDTHTQTAMAQNVYSRAWL
jgi:hypothetical protein